MPGVGGQPASFMGAGHRRGPHPPVTPSCESHFSPADASGPHVGLPEPCSSLGVSGRSEAVACTDPKEWVRVLPHPEPPRLEPREQTAASGTDLSLPGLTFTRNRPYTGRWSDVLITGQEEYLTGQMSSLWRLLYMMRSFRKRRWRLEGHGPRRQCPEPLPRACFVGGIQAPVGLLSCRSLPHPPSPADRVLRCRGWPAQSHRRL